MLSSKKIGLLVALFTLLLVPNLAVRPLWQDEAETALVARQMVNSGIWLPYASDNQGPISQDWNYQFSVSPLWRWHPWVQFYVTAISFKFLGVNTLAARLPFALIGITAFACYLRILSAYGPRSSGFRLIAAFGFLLSVPILLHFRQSRYYALSLLFYLMSIDGYLKLSKGRSGITYIIGSIGLFHSFLPGAFTLQLSFWIHQAYRLAKSRLVPRHDRIFRQFLAAFSVTLLFTMPWAIWLKIGGQNLNFSPELIKQHLIQHYVYIHRFIFPMFGLLPLVHRQTRNKFFHHPTLPLFVIIIATNLILYTVNHPYFFRYLLPVIPLIIFTASWLVTNTKPILAVISLGSVILMLGKTLPSYVLEITRPDVGANTQIIQMLSSLNPAYYNKLAVNYDDFTFRFHTRYLVSGAQQLTQLTDCPDIIIIFPDWGNEERLRTIANECQLALNPTELNYSKLADDPDPINHSFSLPPPRTLEVFLAPPSAN